MINMNPIHSEHDRWKSIIGRMDPYSGKVTIGIHEVLEAHFLLVNYFYKIGEGIGGIGPKSIDLLHSALSRQFVEFGGKPKWSDRLDVCSTLLFGIVKNHPFHDANKRTAFLISILHLQKIGRTPTIEGQKYEDFIVDIADNNLSKYHYYDNINEPSPDREILTISKFLKRSTRSIDLKAKLITYSQLNGILSSRGYKIDNPVGNRIDLLKLTDLNGDNAIKPKRVAHIGFHGWSKQVSMKDISIVREVTKLDAAHGYDSQSFFNGLSDPLSLIEKYKEPLERLAFR